MTCPPASRTNVKFVKYHEFALESDFEGIDHTRTKTKSPQINGICERFHQTIQNEFYVSAFRRKFYASLGQLKTTVDEWVRSYNEERAHSGKHCFGKKLWQTFLDSNAIALEQHLDRTMPIATVAA